MLSKRFFFFFGEKGKEIYYRKSNWNTSSKSLDRSSNHTSKSINKIALRVRAWASLLPSLLTWLKLQQTVEDKIWTSAITCPNIVHDGLALLMALITSNESPSTTIRWIQSSLAKLMVLLATKASTISTDLDVLLSNLKPL